MIWIFRRLNLNIASLKAVVVTLSNCVYPAESVTYTQLLPLGWRVDKAKIHATGAIGGGDG